MLTQPNDDDGSKYSNIVKTNAEHDTSVFTAKGLHQDTPYNAQWEFRRQTLTPTNLEDKTEVKVDKLRYTMALFRDFRLIVF